MYIRNDALYRQNKNSKSKWIPIFLSLAILIIGYFQLRPDPTDGKNDPLPTGPGVTTVEENVAIPFPTDDPSCTEYTSFTNSTQVNVSIERLWNLVGEEFSDEDQKMDVYASIDSSIASSDIKIQYVVEENGTTAIMDNTGDLNYHGVVNTKIFPKGTYTIRAVVTSKCLYLQSKPQTFHVSYPLYVLWTTDWEAQPASQSFIQAGFTQMESISSTYGIPITHFFNPRILINSSYAGMKDWMVDWIKGRRDNNGDEIALHLHMYYDLVQATGVNVRKEPKWANNEDGYDVPSSAYTYDEYMQILNWSIGQYEAYGLGKPVSYRAGGWYADASTLKAVQNSGIKIDSSGRTEYSIGSNDLSGYWRLPVTTVPYHPSLIDPNSDEYSQKLTIWEVANNGGDSWSFPVNSMKERFEQNWVNHAPLSERRMVLYLSHPQWYTQEFPKITQVLQYISQYKYTDDNGPVVYVTVSQLGEVWDQIPQ